MSNINISFRKSLLTLAIMLAMPAAANAQTAVDDNQIIDEGMNRSEVMQLAHELLDDIGPRLSNSPNMRQAEEWAIRKLKEWGLANVRREGFEFGRGWSITSSDVRMLSPRAMPLTAIPIAWTPASAGAISGEVVIAPISKKEHFAKWRGKLSGKIVFISLPGTGDEPKQPAFRRLESKDIGEYDAYSLPEYDPAAEDRREKRVLFAEELDAFLKSEGALAIVRRSRRDGKLLHGEGYAYLKGRSLTLPAVEMAAEDYRRIARFAKNGPAPVISINSNVQYHDGDSQAYNIIAEIPGSDPKAGYVMAGAHFDSWVGGDGAVDNGAGSVTVMEAARLLSKLKVKPKRSIRFVLWAAEEQGLLGSLAYIEKHMASRPPAPASAPSPSFGWSNRFPITVKPGHAEMKAYFNMDNGSGKIRGIYAEGNPAAIPLLGKWTGPYRALGVEKIVAGPTGGTDHVFMQTVGLPAYQFIQDPLDYFARLHHSNIDTFDHLKADDLRQASVVMAGVLLAAANDKDELQRQPVPTKPNPTDPFKYDDPDMD